MEKPDNIIHHSSINLQYPSQQLARKGNLLIEEIFESGIMPQIKTAIEDNVPDETHFEFQKLELDIGQINEKELKTELAKRIRIALEKTLESKLQFSLPNEFSPNLIDGKNNYSIEALKAFLLYGYLPDWYKKTSTLDELIYSIFDQYAHPLKEFLYRNASNVAVRKRLLANLDDTLIGKLYHLFEPVHANWILSIKKSLMRSWKDIAVGFHNVQEFADYLDLFILDYLLQNRSPSFSKKDFNQRLWQLLQKLSKGNFEVSKLEDVINDKYLAELATEIRLSDKSTRLKIPSQIQDPEDLAALLNKVAIKKIKIKKADLQRQIEKLINDEELLAQFFAKLDDSGVRRLLELLQPKEAAKVARLIESFVKEMSIEAAPAIIGGRKVNFKELALLSILYLNKSREQAIDKDILAGLFASTVSSSLNSIIRSSSFKNFIGAQKELSFKQVRSLIQKEDQVQKIWEAQHELSKAAIFSTSTLESAPSVDLARLSLLKRKIITNYLLSGSPPDQYADLSLQDLRSVFADLLQIKDDFLVHAIRLTRKAEELLERIDLLSDAQVKAYLPGYLHHFYGKEIALLTAQISAMDQVLSIGKKDLPEEWRTTLIVKTLILGKGDTQSELLKGALFVQWIKMLVAEAQLTKAILLPVAERGKKKTHEVARFFSALDKSSKAWIRERYIQEGAELLEFVRGKSWVLASDSTTRISAIVHSLFIYQQFDDRFLRELLFKYPKHQLQLLSTFESHLKKGEWEDLLKVIKRSDQLTNIVSAFEKPPLADFSSLPPLIQDSKTKLAKDHQTPDAQLRKLWFARLLQDDQAFDRFISSKTDSEIASVILFKEKAIQFSLKSLFSFHPKAISTKGGGRLWRSLIIRFAIQKYVDDSAISSAKFASDLQQYLSHQIGFSENHIQVRDLLYEFKASKQKGLAKLFSDIDGTVTSSFVTTEGEQPETSSKISDLLGVLRFYASNKQLPWWAPQRDLAAVIRELTSFSLAYSRVFEKEVKREEKTHSTISSIAQFLPANDLSRLGSLLSPYPKTKLTWEKSLKKTKKHPEDETTASGTDRRAHVEKLVDKQNDGVESLIEPLLQDPKQLSKLLYKYTDDELITSLFAKLPEVQKQLHVYLRISNYLYHAGATPPKWRLAVYTVAISLIRQPGPSGSFDQKLVEYLESKTDGIDWAAALSKVSSLPAVNFPETLKLFLDRRALTTTTAPKADQEVKKEDVTKSQQSVEVATAHDESNESVRMLMMKRKIISAYLLSGHLAGVHADLSLHDLRLIFVDLLQTNDDFLVRLIQKTSTGDLLAARITQLIDASSGSHLREYLQHFYAEAYSLLTAQLSALEQVLPISEKDQAGDWQTALILKALILSKGDSNAIVSKGVLFVKWIAMLSTESVQTKKAFLSALEHGKKKQTKVLKLYSKLDESTKQWIRERYMVQVGELIAIRGIKTSLSQVSKSSKELSKVASSLFIYQQFDRQFISEAMIHYPNDQWLLLSAFQLYLGKADWKILMKTLGKDDMLKKVVISYEKYSSESFSRLPSVTSKQISQLPRSKKVHQEVIESSRLWFFKLLQDDRAFDRFVAAMTTIQLALNLRFEDKKIQSSLASLLSFTPNAVSKKGGPQRWRSLIIRYVVEKFIDDPAISAAKLTSGFKQYLLLQTELRIGASMAEDILLELKTSPRKDLAKLFIAKDSKVTGQAFAEGKKQSQPLDAVKHLIPVLHFYAAHQYLPWWFVHKDLSSLIDAVLLAAHTKPRTFEKELVKEEHATSLISTLAQVIPRADHIKLGEAFLMHQELKPIWKAALKKLKKKHAEGISTVEFDRQPRLERQVDERLVGIELLVTSVLQDPELLSPMLYKYSDSELIPLLFARHPDIHKQMKAYLELSRYIYYQGATPPKWRLAIYRVALDLIRQSTQKKTIDQKLIEYIEGNKDGIDWIAVFQSVSTLPQIKLPKAISILLDQHSPTRKRQPVLELKTDQPSARKASFDIDEDVEFEANISNAGLIITWPFLTRLFEHFGFLKDGKFLNTERQTRAVYLLQYMVYNDIEFPEYELLLNKILVGMPLKIHLDTSLELTQDEKEMTTSLLNGIIQNWEKVKNSSPEGIQETFLQRDGLIQIQHDKVVLNIEKKGVDVLLDSISWNIGLVKLPWMLKPLHINWL